MSGLPAAVFLGEVDCGKSTLIGRLLHDTGSLSDDALREFEKSWRELGRGPEFAYLLDSFQEEQLGEFTLDTTQAVLRLGGGGLRLIDVPGHLHLVKNMLTGASGADSAVLVVDAGRGVRPQTTRHLCLLALLGVEEASVAVNKMDAVSYSEGRFAQVRTEARDLFREAGLALRSVIPVSAREGENLLARSGRMPWYAGEALIEALARPREAARPRDFRFPVQDVYDHEGERVVVGTVASGEVSEGGRVGVAPSGAWLEVRGLRVFGEKRRMAEAGESIGLVLSGDGTGPRRGDVLYGGAPPAVAGRVRAVVYCLGRLAAGRGYSMLCATQEARCRLAAIKERLDSGTLSPLDPGGSLEEHDLAEVALELAAPLVAESFRDCPPLGRFLLLSGEEPVAVGMVRPAGASRHGAG